MAKRDLKQIRKQRVRTALKKRAKGTLRLNIFRSNKHIYAQIIDDIHGKTIVAASSLEPDFKEMEKKTNIEKASLVGKIVAERAIDKKIVKVVFDKGSYKYHGRVQAVAEGVRAGGLKV